jgi:carbon storage regulator
MLVLSRRKNESVIIGDDIVITVVEVRGDKVRLGLVVPKEKPVHRKEVWDVLYGPLLRVILDPAWLTWNDGIVLRLATAIAEERNYDALPILADALEEAGCTDVAILSYCRSFSQDDRGSWVVDLILSPA